MTAQMWNLPNKSADLLLFFVKCFAMVASPVIALLVASFNCGVYKDITGTHYISFLLPHVNSATLMTAHGKTILSLIYNLKFCSNYILRRYKLAWIFYLPLFLLRRSFDHKIHINMMQDFLIPLLPPSRALVNVNLHKTINWRTCFYEKERRK